VKLSSKTAIHRNSPLSLEARRRLVERCKTRPIAQVAAEMGISRACASTWVYRYRRYGKLGLVDRSSTSRRQPAATDTITVTKVEDLRRTHQWSAAFRHRRLVSPTVSPSSLACRSPAAPRPGGLQQSRTGSRRDAAPPKCATSISSPFRAYCCPTTCRPRDDAVVEVRVSFRKAVKSRGSRPRTAATPDSRWALRPSSTSSNRWASPVASS
jgi:Helix-turn-helix domain